MATAADIPRLHCENGKTCWSPLRHLGLRECPCYCPDCQEAKQQGWKNAYVESEAMKDPRKKQAEMQRRTQAEEREKQEEQQRLAEEARRQKQQQEAEEARRQKQKAEEVLRQQQEAEARRRKEQEEEARRRKQQQEAEEARRRKEQEEAERRRRLAEEEARRQKQQAEEALRQQQEAEARRRKEQEELQRRQQLDVLLDGLDIDEEIKDTLYRNKLTSAERIASVDLAILTGIGIPLGDAAILKKKYSQPSAIPNPIFAPPTTTVPTGGPEAQLKADMQGRCTSFRDSAFKRLYNAAKPVDLQHQLFLAAHGLIMAYCAVHSLDPKKGEAFFRAVEKEAFENKDELLSNVDAAAQRMWTSVLQLDGCGAEHQKELCSLINAAIRGDCEPLLTPAVQLVRNINQLCGVRRKGVPVFPPNGICFRGSGLPDVRRDFFKVGVKYRVPGFLATSFSEGVAFQFLFRAHQDSQLPAVLWRVHLDPRGETDFRFRCKHVNLVRHTNVPGEEEFLFAPYSAFQVREVQWNVGDDLNPHIIDVDAAIDNRLEAEDLPLAPFY